MDHGHGAEPEDEPLPDEPLRNKIGTRVSNGRSTNTSVTCAHLPEDPDPDPDDPDPDDPDPDDPLKGRKTGTRRVSSGKQTHQVASRSGAHLPEDPDPDDPDDPLRRGNETSEQPETNTSSRVTAVHTSPRIPIPTIQTIPIPTIR